MAASVEQLFDRCPDEMEQLAGFVSENKELLAIEGDDPAQILNQIGPMYVAIMESDSCRSSLERVQDEYPQLSGNSGASPFYAVSTALGVAAIVVVFVVVGAVCIWGAIVVPDPEKKGSDDEKKEEKKVGDDTG